MTSTGTTRTRAVRRVVLGAVPGLAVAAVVVGIVLAGGTSSTGGAGGGPSGTSLPPTRFAVQPRPSQETWIRGEPTFPITDALRAPGASRPLYAFTPDTSAADLAARAAAAFGITGRPQPVSMQGVAQWSVFDDLSSGVSVGDWPSRALSFTPGLRREALQCRGGVAADAAGRCPAGTDPPPYDAAAALRDAAALVTRLGGHPLDWRARPPAGWVTVVEGRLPATGADGPVLWELTFAPSGRITGALGPLAPLRSVGDYPTISVADAVARLDADWLPRAPFAFGPPVTGCPPAAPVPTDPSNPDPTGAPAVTLSAVRLAAMPATTVAPGSAYPLPVSSATPGYALLNDARCRQYLAPVVRFRGPGGDELPVLALPDGALEHRPQSPQPTGTPSGRPVAAAS